jgi:subtilisin family serine protease
MVKLLRLNGKLSFLFFFLTTTTSEAISLHDKISRFINSTTEGIKEVIQQFMSANASASAPRRVWITYSKGSHVSVLSNMDMHRSNSSTLSAMFDFPAMNSIVTMATDEEIALLLANASSGVINITDDPKRYPMARGSSLRHLRQVQERNLQQSWDGQLANYGIGLTQVDQLRSATGLDGAGITVCVIDSGLDVTHEDFNTTGYSGVTLIAGSEWSSDSNGHGTHVSGIIAAADNTIGLVGVAPRATIYTVDIFGDNGYSYASALIDGLYKCRDAGAQIISMSLGGASYTDQENTMFQELYNFNGILSVAAAGNSGNSELSFPASYNNVLSVGAVDSSKTLASFSQYNAYVDLVAPGVGIWSTLPTSSCEMCSEIGRTTYGPLDGTSQATPFVSGIAALLKSFNPSLSVETITNALLNSAEDLGSAGRDDLYGYGLVSALNAYNLLTSSTGITAPPTTEPPISDPGATTPPSPCAEATLFLRTDDYPYETYVSLYDLSSNVYIWLSGADLANTDYSLSSACLDANGCYEFTITDTVGDGLCCLYGLGYFELSYNGEPVVTGDAIGFGLTYLLGDGCQA